MRHTIKAVDKTVLLVGVALSAVVLSPLMVDAQQTDDPDASKKHPVDDSTETGKSKNEKEETNASQNPDPSSYAEQISSLKRELADQKAQMRAMDERNAKTEAEVQTLRETMVTEDYIFEVLDNPNEAESNLLSFWGFYDMLYSKRFYKESSSYNFYMSTTSSFVLTNVNLYLKSTLTNTFSVLLETLMTFLPVAQEEEIEYADIPGTAYKRWDMLVSNPDSSEEFNIGGISIERVQLQWSPKDWFNILAGRFLTPFGIWNIDHGSPVVIPIRVPYMQLRQMVIKAQTGIQIYGRFFPFDNVYLDYAFTVSNGRCPTEAVHDLDENKAVGLRLQLTINTADVRFSFGGYGYVGTDKDQKKVVFSEIGPDGALDMNAEDPVRVERIDLATGREIVLTADMKLSFFGIVLQGEYVWKRMDFTDPYLFNTQHTVMQGGSAIDEWYYASYLGYSGYGLVAYTLPLDRWIDPVAVTPYFYIEKNISYDTASFVNFTTIWSGINVKPTAFLTLKAEYMYTIPEDKKLYSNMHGVSVQAAVSF